MSLISQNIFSNVIRRYASKLQYQILVVKQDNFDKNIYFINCGGNKYTAYTTYVVYVGTYIPI